MDRTRLKMLNVITYLACINGKSINRLKLIKLLWIADKYHLLRYGRTIIKDSYFALPNGPAATTALNICTSPEIYEASEYLSLEGRHDVRSIKDPDLKYLSKSDINVIDKVFARFGADDRFCLKNMSHEYKEWKRWKELIEDNTKKDSYKMEMIDFFELPEPSSTNNVDFFDIDTNIINESLETYELRGKFE